MQSIGAFQAKTHLSQLLNAVEHHGETIAITRHGQVVAWLVPAQENKVSDANPIQQAIDTIRNIRKGITLGEELTIKKLIEEGRR